MSVSKSNPSVLDLPEELVEYILLHVSTYGELQNCALVSRLWHRLSNGSKLRLYTLFNRADSFEWFLLNQSDLTRSVAERCSHASTFHRATKSVIIFGGCTAAYTTFNDMWKFDLMSRSWNRVLPQGEYPTPKACATLVDYKTDLYLFGGWAKSSPNPIHQTAMFYNELHVFNHANNTWTAINDDAPHLAGHSASVLGQSMIVFGGSHGTGSSNTVYVFDFASHNWSIPQCSTTKPLPRYGQSQMSLDDSHVLIIGGCGGPNLIFADVWLLTADLTHGECKWEEVTVTNPSLSAPQLWSHPAVKISRDKVVVLSKAQPPNRDRSNSVTIREMSTTQRQGGGNCTSGANWTPPQGNLIPPRRRLISSRSLDEKNPPPSPKFDHRKNAELQRAQSIPTIIVGEIPKLVVTNNDSDDRQSPNDDDQPGPSGINRGAENRCIAMAESSLIPNQSTPVDAPTNSDNPRGAINMPPQGIARGTRYYRDRANPSMKANACSNRERQLEMLRRMEERLRCNTNQQQSFSEASSDSANSSGQSSPKLRFRPSSPPPKSKYRRPTTFAMSRHPMQVYILDISQALSQRFVTWSVLETELDAPEDTILHSLCVAWGELIMFGGMRSNNTPAQQGLHVTPFSHMITNETYILRPHISL